MTKPRPGLWARLRRLWDGSVTRSAATVRDAVTDGEDVYKHLLWQMAQEAGSPDEAWAGGAELGELLEKHPTVDALLDAKPRLARYRASDNGEGPLFWACFYGPLSLVQRLVKMGASPKATSWKSVLIWYKPGGMTYVPEGCTTLMMAAAGGQTEICRYLLEKGVPVDAVARDADKPESEKGHTALFMATRGRGTGETARVLLEAGADPNLGEAIGFTPAGEAAQRGAGDVLEALADAGADLGVPSGSKSVMELAGEADDPSAMRPLIKGTFGRVLTLDNVTEALDAADLEYQVVPRGEIPEGADELRYMPVYAKIMGEDHWDIEGTPDFYIFVGRSYDELSAFDLEEWLEDMGVGSRRFGSDGEIKGVLGIAEGGITPFAEVNDRHGQVDFRWFLTSMGEGRIAVEAFDQTRVIVLAAADVGGAVSAFEERVGPL